MAIDADLNAGLMTPTKRKRAPHRVRDRGRFLRLDGRLVQVREGDAIAGLLILFDQHRRRADPRRGQPRIAIGAAAQTYILLAIGDALVAQLPSLMLSIAAAGSSPASPQPQDLAGQIGTQFGIPRTWTPVAVILACSA